MRGLWSIRGVWKCSFGYIWRNWWSNKKRTLSTRSVWRTTIGWRRLLEHRAQLCPTGGASGIGKEQEAEVRQHLKSLEQQHQEAEVLEHLQRPEAENLEHQARLEDIRLPWL